MAENTYGANEAGKLASEVGVPPKDEAKPGLPQLDGSTYSSQLVWLAITFAALYWYFSKLVLPKIGQVLEERHDKIAADLDKAAEMQKKSEQAMAEYEAALNEARGKAHSIAQGMRDSLKEETDRQKAALDADLAEKLEQAEARIRETKDAALANVKTVAEDVAGSIVETMTGRAPDATRIAEAVARQMSS
ncbi:MAG: F0F1 ATP synthase subunit B' [Pseudomonadota bacterium]